MAIFRFPWQTLLNWKQNLEELSQMKLAAKAGAVRAQEEEIRSLAGRRRAIAAEIEAKARQVIRADEYALYQEFAEISGQELVQRKTRKEVAVREMNEAREVLLRLTKEKKILEKLKEKKLKDFVRETQKSEQKTDDERVTLRYRPRFR